ncbi:hypothetical protein ABW19_dt0202361 [Dactylella cylindrospora]|nr:hypothetical protein ABW19_dt0202361 [Dactylella cylindrospora]
MAPGALVVGLVFAKVQEATKLILRMTSILSVLSALSSFAINTLLPSYISSHGLPMSVSGWFLVAVLAQIFEAIIGAASTDYFDIAERLKNSGESRLAPRFFFCASRHLRLSPNGYFFQYPILYVGMTTKFVDSIGWLFSVKESEQEAKQSDLNSRRTPSRFTFFKLDPRAYMNSKVGFDEKARSFLRLNGVDDTSYPHIYLVTSPWFIWFHFNPVTYWYVYTADYHLAYTILEVTNTFGESHAYLLPRDDSPRKNERFLYTYRFKKDFHISPFNKRSGEYEADITDVVAEGRFDIKITVLKEEGKKKMTAQTMSVGEPMDLLSTGFFEGLRMMVQWAMTGFLVVPRTLWECWRIFGMKEIEVHARPEPLKGSKGRPPSSLER